MTDSPLVLDLLIAFGAFQALFISIVFLVQPKTNKTKRYFSIFLIIEGITLVERLLAETGLMSSFPHILGVSYPLSFIKPPVLLFAALSIVNPSFRLRKIHILNFLPFAAILAINIPFYLQEAATKVQFVEAFITSVPAYGSFGFFLSLSFFAHIGIYLALTIKTLMRYRLHIKNNRLANWYLTMIILYSTILFITLVYFVLLPSGRLEIPFFNVVSMLIMTFLIQSIAYRFFVGADVFSAKSNPSLKDVEQRLSHEQLIKEKLQRDKPFLEDNLSLEAFASSIDLSRKQVSDLVNQRFGCSFKELINRYRIEEAKYLMQIDKPPYRQLIEIAEESGFNNKVSFYRAFKKHTGKSPSEYQHELRPTTQSN